MIRRLKRIPPLQMFVSLIAITAIVIAVSYNRGTVARKQSPGGVVLIPPSTTHPTLDGEPGVSATLFANVARYQAACEEQHIQCRDYVVALINTSRAAVGAPRLRLNWNLSRGDGCVGAIGHSKAMALLNDPNQPIWHKSPDSRYSYASFNDDMYPCVGPVAQSQNVGLSAGPDGALAINYINQAMMTEQHDPAYCATYTNHACTILSFTYRQIGVGIVRSNGNIYLTEDFAG